MILILLDETEGMMAGRTRNDARLELLNQTMANSTDLITASTTFLEAFGNAAAASKEILFCAANTYLAVKQLEAASAQLEMKTRVSLEKVAASAPMVEKSLDRTLDQCERVLDRILGMETHDMTPTQVVMRERLIELAMNLNNRAHETLIAFMGV